MNKFLTLLAPLILGSSIAAKAAVSYATLGIAGDTNAFIFGNVHATEGGSPRGRWWWAEIFPEPTTMSGW